MTAPVPYSRRLLELFRTTPGAGPVGAGPGTCMAAESGRLVDGAWVRLEVRVLAGRVLAAGFQAWGCPQVIAAAALAASRLPGMTAEEMRGVDARALAGELESPATKLGRLLKVEDCICELAARIESAGR